MNTPPSPEARIVILGAGPTGLGAAYRLQELGYRNWAIYERNDYVGGLATSFTDDYGFTYDIGGHVMFSHYKYFDDLVDKMLGDEYTEIMREAWVWMMDRFVPYPFQNNISYLPDEVVLECVLGLLEAQRNPDAVAQATNFNDLIDAQFGAGIARHFMKPYNFKVWAHPIEHMSRDWLGERVAIPSLERILTNVILNQADKGWGPNNKFKYPLYGGTGGLYSPMVKIIGDHLHFGKTAVQIDQHAKQVRFSDGEVVDYDLLLSTMPIDLLVERMVDVPDRIVDARDGLHHSSGLIVGVGVQRANDSEKCWMYFPEDTSPYYRVTYLSNYSPFIVPQDADYFLLLSETSYSEHKPEDKNTIVDRVIQGFLKTKLLEPSDLDRLMSTYVIDVDYSYPVPTLDRNLALGTIQPYLMQHGIYSRGRFGAWEYEIGNMDHSVMQGVELVNRWLFNEPEVTWKDFAHVAEAHAPLHVNGAAGNGAVPNGVAVNGQANGAPHNGVAVHDVTEMVQANSGDGHPIDFTSKHGHGLIRTGSATFDPASFDAPSPKQPGEPSAPDSLPRLNE
ncbi:MAG: FAD-dependent oxidoreductase [Chloroflexi bacterium]|nr:FAD-dependent oxidoreductase [Chloroflexota bacterium]